MNKTDLTADLINELRSEIRKTHPLIHCITNPISINQCANTILAVGARPMCAEHPMEAAAVTSGSKAVMLNLGNITDVRMESMRISAKEAHKLGRRFVLDVCGAAGLENRRLYAQALIEEYVPTVIKGNYSEIKALRYPDYKSSGVDSDPKLEPAEIIEAAGYLALKYGTVVLASGKTDIVTDGNSVYQIDNGSPQLSTVTGTGCMQGALCAAFLSAADGALAAVSAAVMLGICGELAETDRGSGSFMVNLMDRLSTISDEVISAKCRFKLPRKRRGCFRGDLYTMRV